MLDALTKAQCKCNVRCECTHGNTLHVHCTLSDHAPVHSVSEAYTKRTHYTHSVRCKCSQMCIVSVQFTLYVDALLHISRAVHTVSARKGLHFKCMGECNYRVQYKFNDWGAPFC